MSPIALQMRLDGQKSDRDRAFEPSTKTCNNCGAINQTLTLADREWTCASCLVTHDRDVNAAKNIKFMGLKTRQGMSGEPVELRRLRRAKKQEVLP